VTPSTIPANSAAADNGQPDADHDGGFWMLAGMRRLTDLGLGLVVVLFAAPGAFAGWPQRQPRELVLTLAMILPLLGRRRWPTLVFGFVAAVALAQWLTGGQPMGSDLALLVAFYTVAAYEPLRSTVFCAAVLELGIVLAAARWSNGRSQLYLIVLLSGMGVAAGVLGLNVRTRRAYLDSLRDRAERLERDRDQQALIATAAERARIAREMHDVVAHHLAVMTALADGARFALAAHPDQAATALEAVSATGRSALADMHALLGILPDRSGDEPVQTSPQPGLDALGDLAAQVTDAGLPVTFTIAHDNAFPVAQGLQLVAYRVVQEALTNTLKHGGGGARARVDVQVTGRTLEVEVVDAGGIPSIRPYGAQPTQGRGLLGMSERVAAYEGTLEAGPRPQGGWRVRALLPRTEDDQL
jgi:signal transduction histidine kinase